MFPIQAIHTLLLCVWEKRSKRLCGAWPQVQSHAASLYLGKESETRKIYVQSYESTVARDDQKIQAEKNYSHSAFSRLFYRIRRRSSMEPIVSAVVGDLICRSISFAIDRYCHRRHKGTVQDNLQRLRRVLLRIQATVEEAERRRVTNQAMLQQLHLMREGMYRGYYLLNAITRHVDGGGQDKARGREVSRLKHSSSLALSEFNPAKRICILPARTTTTTTVTASYTRREAEAELQGVLIDMERMASDMKELTLFLSCYPPLPREPYSSHLWLENRMFGRDAEYERIIRFLLEPERAGAQDLAVLPVVGRARVGKSTLVEHVCRDERVRAHFSLIVFLGESDIVGENLHLMPLGDRGVIKYRNSLASTTGSSLVVTEVVGDVDESTWRRTLSALNSEERTHGTCQ